VLLVDGRVKGDIQLPDSKAMWADVRRTQAMHETRFKQSNKRYLLVDYITYMDELGHMIGCTPPSFRQFALSVASLHRVSNKKA